MLCLDKDVVGPWIARHCNMVWTPENSNAIGWLKDGQVCAGVWYEDYNQVSVMCHIAITGKMTPEYLNIIFDYPFVQLGVDKIVVPVLSDNEASIKFVKNLGFEEKARLLDISPNGDMLFFVMTKDKCRFIGERYGKRRRRWSTRT
jgi:L-amino acid N-acyltransferase YncA